MSNSQVLAILFDGDSGNSFYAGQLVTGHVQLQTSERIKIRGIRLEVTGKAETSWTEGMSDNESSYSGTEEFMNLDICLIGSPSEATEMYLEPSVCEFPFSFTLPAELPRSYEDNVGHVRYKAKAVIDWPKNKKDETEVIFKVSRLLDLNQEPPQLREPLVMHSETPAIHCWDVDGFIEINATINRGCFVPGETMRIDGEIANRTNTNIKHSKIIIFQSIEYWATHKNENVYHTCSETNLAIFKRPFLPRGHTDSWNNILFVVPEVSSSRLDGCRIINIKYFVKICPTFEGCCRKDSSEVSSEFVIGNIPLRDDFQPSVVTSQPVGLPMPYITSVGYMPPAYTCAPTLGYDTAEVKAWNHDGKELPEVDAF